MKTEKKIQWYFLAILFAGTFYYIIETIIENI